MTRSSENNMNNVAEEINKLEAEYGKNFRIIPPNDQIKGEKAHCKIFICHIYL